MSANTSSAVRVRRKVSPDRSRQDWPNYASSVIPLSDRGVVMGLADLAGLQSALAVSVIAMVRVGPQELGPWQEAFGLRATTGFLWWAVLLAALWYPIASALGAYEPGNISRLSPSLKAVVLAGGITFPLFLSLPYLHPLRFSVVNLAILLGTGLALQLLFRSAAVLILSNRRFRHRVLILGAGSGGERILAVLAPIDQYDVVGFVDADSGNMGKVVGPDDPEGRAPQAEVLGDHRALSDLVASRGISMIVVALGEPEEDCFSILMSCLERGVEVVPMPLLFERLTGRVPIDDLGPHWPFAVPQRHPRHRMILGAARRVMDIGLAGLGAACLLPLLPVIAAAICLESPGPVFYTQQRVGRGGTTFRLWKFRSMVPDAESGLAVWAKEKDPRATRVGRILRATHLDEFPQFWNILKGEMSAVGPRPERPEFVEQLGRVIPFYGLRHVVKPGMAGWGLVRQGYSGSSEDALLKLQHDLYYIRYQSIFLEITQPIFCNWSGNQVSPSYSNRPGSDTAGRLTTPRESPPTRPRSISRPRLRWGRSRPPGCGAGPPCSPVPVG